MMHSSGNFLSTPNLDYEAWRNVVRLICGRYTPNGIEPNTFSGRARVRSICGLKAVELSSNAHRLERTRQTADIGRSFVSFLRFWAWRRGIRLARRWGALYLSKIKSGHIGGVARREL